MAGNIFFRLPSADVTVDNVARDAATQAQNTAHQALANSATALDRAEHVGQQPLSSISDAGTAAAHDVGRGPGNIPVLDQSGKLNPSTYAMSDSSVIRSTSWNVGATLAEGVVTNSAAAPAGNDIGLKAFPASSKVVADSTYIANASTTTTPVPDDSSAFDVGVSVESLAGTDGFRQSVDDNFSDPAGYAGVSLVDSSSTPALASGTYLWVAFDKILRSDGGQIVFSLVLEDGQVDSRGSVEIHLGPGTVTSTGAHSRWVEQGSNPSIGDYIRPPGNSDVDIIELGDGYYSVKMRYTIFEDTPANWNYYIGPPTPTQNELIEFAAPKIIPNSRSSAWGSGATYWTVPDPKVGVHPTAAPVVLECMAAKPSGAGTVLELRWNNGSGDNNGSARVDIDAGSPVLKLSEDGEKSTRTATLPAHAWSSTHPTDVALRLENDEVVLFIDNHAATGLPLIDSIAAVTGYALGARTDGTRSSALRPESAKDANGLKARGESWRIMTADEYAALPVVLPGRLYAEVS